MPPKTCHVELETFLQAINLTEGTTIRVTLEPKRHLRLNCDQHELIFDIREASHGTQVGSLVAFAKVLVAGLRLGLRASSLRAVLSGNPEVVEYMNLGNRWTSRHHLVKEYTLDFDIVIVAQSEAS